MREHLGALAGGCVSGAHGHAQRTQLHALPGGCPADAGQRRLQVALDVVVERLERRDVEQADAALAPRSLLAPIQPIDAPQEGGQGFA